PSSSAWTGWKAGAYRPSTVATMAGPPWWTPRRRMGGNGFQPRPMVAARSSRPRVAAARGRSVLFLVHPDKQVLQPPVRIVLLQQGEALLLGDRQDRSEERRVGKGWRTAGAAQP